MAPLVAQQQRQRVLTDLLVEFMEVAVHEFLYVWKLYPAESFADRVKYDVPVHMNRHPQLCEYIHAMLRGCHEWIAQGLLEKLCVVVLAENGRVVDTLVLETAWSRQAPRNPSSSTEASSTSADDEPLPLRAIEEHFCASLVSLAALRCVSTYDQDHEPNSDSKRFFRLLAHTVEAAARPETAIAPHSPANSWILADPFWYEQQEEKREMELVPIRATRSEIVPFQMQIYLERK